MDAKNGIYGGRFIVDKQEQRLSALEKDVKRLKSRLAWYEV